MKEELTIEEWTIKNQLWRESAVAAIGDQVEVSQEALVPEIELHAEILAMSVIRGGITVKQLKRGVAWANALDREAVTLFGTSDLKGDQLHERTARRIMHHAGRIALDEVKSPIKRLRRITDQHLRQNQVQ